MDVTPFWGPGDDFNNLPRLDAVSYPAQMHSPSPHSSTSAAPALTRRLRKWWWLLPGVLTMAAWLWLRTDTEGLLLCALLALLAPVWILAGSIVFVAGIGLVVPGLNFLVAAASAPDLRPLRGQATALYAFTLFVGTSFAPGLNQVLRPLPLSGGLLILALIMGVAVLCNMAGRRVGASVDGKQTG